MKEARKGKKVAIVGASTITEDDVLKSIKELKNSSSNVQMIFMEDIESLAKCFEKKTSKKLLFIPTPTRVERRKQKRRNKQ